MARDSVITEYRVISAQATKGLNEIKSAGTSAASGMGQASKASKTLGNDFAKAKSSTDGFAGSIKNLVTSFLAFEAIRQVLTGSIATIKDFEASLSSLQSITGVTTEELGKYREAAIKIGGATSFSAGQVAQAFEIIGSKAPQLLESSDALIAVTEQALTLAEAAKIDIPEAASALTAALNQFQLPAEESQRVIDALANGSKYGSATITELSESFKNSAAVANNYNVSVEETVAILESLAKGSLTGAEAGTKLRSVLLTMQGLEILPPKTLAAVRALGVDVDKVTDSTIPFNERWAEMQKVFADSNVALQVFGRENISAAQTLNAQSDTLTELLPKISEYGTAQEQAAINTDNLQGAFNRLSSAWESIVLSVSEGGGILRDVIEFLAANLETIIKLAATAAAGFIAYHVAVKGVAVATTLFNAAQKAAIIIQALLTGGIQKAQAAMRLLNVTMAANPIGIVAAAVAGLIAAFSLFTSEASAAEKAQANIQKAWQDGAVEVARVRTETEALVKTALGPLKPAADGAGAAMKNAATSGAQLGKVSKEQSAAIRELNAQIPDYIGNLTAENIATEEGAQILDRYNKHVEENTRLKTLQKLRAEGTEQAIRLETSAIEDHIPWYVDWMNTISDAIPVFSQFSEEIDEITKSIGEQERAAAVEKQEEYNRALAVSEGVQRERMRLMGLSVEMEKLVGDVVSENEEAERQAAEATRKRNQEIEKLTQTVAAYRSQAEELEARESGGDVAAIELARQRAIEEFNIFVAQQEKLKESERLTAEEIGAIRKSIHEQYNEEILALDQEYQAKTKEMQEANLQRQADGLDRNLEEIKLSQKQALLNEELTAEQRAQLEKGLQEEAIQDEIEYLERKRALFEGNAQELLNIDNRLADIRLGLIKKEEEDEAASLAKRKEQIREFAQFAQQQAVEIFNLATEIRVNNLEGDLQSLQARRDADLENFQGTEEEKARLEEGYRKQEAAIKKKQFEAERQAAIVNVLNNSGIAVLRAFSQFPPPNPLLGLSLGLIAAQSALQVAAIASRPVPQFAKGVIDLPGPGTGTSDSIHAKLSRGESVMTARETKLYKGELLAMRKGEFDKYLADTYVAPALANYAKMNANRSDVSIDKEGHRISRKTNEYLRLLASKNSELSRESVEEIKRAIVNAQPSKRRGW